MDIFLCIAFSLFSIALIIAMIIDSGFIGFLVSSAMVCILYKYVFIKDE